MTGFAISVASFAVIAVVAGFGLFLQDYRGGVACKADRAQVEQLAMTNYDRWQTERASSEASCREEIASATDLARQEGAIEAAEKTLASLPSNSEGSCNVDSPIRWSE